jgi:hypothetical protein
MSVWAFRQQEDHSTIILNPNTLDVSACSSRHLVPPVCAVCVRPTHAEATRNLLEILEKKSGQLYTTHHRTGYPYGSICNFATLGDGRIVTFVSKLAEHSANISADPRVALLISQTVG